MNDFLARVELAVVSIAVVSEQFFEAVKAVRLEVAWICLVLAVFELLIIHNQVS